MTIKKCDRCGAIIEDPKRNKNVFDAMRDAIKKLTCYEITYKITRFIDGEPEVCYMDLCEKCNQDLKEWLNVSTDEKRPKTETFIIAKMPDDIGGKV